MAKIVIAGKSDCPYYARAELLGDALATNFADFKVHKIVKQPLEWVNWLKDTCGSKGWIHQQSPLIWRELVDRGGKGTLIGGANEFQEYANAYYGYETELQSDDMLKVAAENQVTKVEIDEEEKIWKNQSQPVNMCITNASGHLVYGMLNQITQGNCLGEDVEISLHFLDDQSRAELMEGVKMETFDMAHPLLRNITCHHDPASAFKNCKYVIITDVIEPITENEGAKSLLRKYYELATKYAKAIAQYALPDVRVLVAGDGPVNFIVRAILHEEKSLKRHQVLGVSQTCEDRAKAVIARRLKVNPSGIYDLAIWGNVNGAHLIDASRARISGYDGAVWGPKFFTRDVTEMIANDAWIEKDFVEMVEARKSELKEALKHHSSSSEASSVVRTLTHLVRGVENDQFFSLSIASNGEYDIPLNVVASMPVRFLGNNEWEVVNGLSLTDLQKQILSQSCEELQNEWEVIHMDPTRPRKAADVYYDIAPSSTTSTSAQSVSAANDPTIQRGNSTVLDRIDEGAEEAELDTADHVLKPEYD